MLRRATASKSRVRRTPGFSQRLARYSVGTLTLAGSAGLAHADFSGMYAVTPPDAGNYTLSGNQTFGTWSSSETDFGDGGIANLDDTDAPASLTLQATAGAPDPSDNFFNTAPVAGTFSFDYTATGDCNVVVNGTQTSLNGTSTYSIPLNAGDSFGFSIAAFYFGTSSLTISNFSAPIPEPGAAGWIAAGAAGLLATRALRRRSARASVQG